MRSAAQSVHLVAASVGFLSYLLLWATVMWGMLLGRGWTMTRFKYANVYATHMTLALIAMTLGWGHAFAQLANPVGTVYLIDEFVPFVNGHDPVGIGVGVVAAEIMTALLISVPLQRRLGDRRWRKLHSLAYVSFTLLAAHVLLSGSDVGPLAVKIPVIGLWLSTVVGWLVLAVRTRTGRAARGGAYDRDGAYDGADDERGRAGARVGGPPVRVQVNPGKCARFGFCEQEAPEVFRLRGDGRLDYRPSAPGEYAEVVDRAVKACPARAIIMSRPDRGNTSRGRASRDKAPRDKAARRAPRARRGSAGRPADDGDDLLAHVIDLRRE